MLFLFLVFQFVGLFALLYSGEYLVKLFSDDLFLLVEAEE